MESGKGGGNSYWPGFVDALTNVIIAMIFVVVVLAIALSFAAQLMGKRVADKLISEYKAQAAASAASAASAVAPAPQVAAVEAPVVPESRLLGKTVIPVKGNEAASAVASPQLTPARNTLELKYAAGALTLDEAALKALENTLKALPEAVRKQGIVLVASGPSMVLSDNQRAAFLRLMDVRNALMAQGFMGPSITTRIDTEREISTATISIAFTDKP